MWKQNAVAAVVVHGKVDIVAYLCMRSKVSSVLTSDIGKDYDTGWCQQCSVVVKISMDLCICR